MDGSYCVKPLKQKQVVNICSSSSFLPPSLLKTHQSFISCRGFLSSLPPLQVDGVSYLLQEIYGIENKYNSQESKVNARLAAR